MLKCDEGAPTGARSWLIHPREFPSTGASRAKSRESVLALNGGVNTATMRASESSANIVAE